MKEAKRQVSGHTGPQEDHKYFDVLFRDISKTGFSVYLKQEGLANELKKITNDSSLYESVPRIISETLEKVLPDLKQAITDSSSEKVGTEAQELANVEQKEKEKENIKIQQEALRELIQYIETHFALLLEQAENILKAEKINFDNLSFLFRKKDKIFSFDDLGKWAGEITNTKFQTGHSSRVFIIYVNTIDTEGSGFYVVSKQVYISEFEGVKEFSALPAWRLDPKSHDELSERGKLFEKYGLGKHYQFHKGTIIRKEAWRAVRYRADGRIMVDCTNFQRFNPNYSLRVYRTNSSEPGMTSIPAAQLYMCAPTVRGFSFYAKKWGEINLENLSPIVFNDNAFEQLVLDEGRKRLIKALVLHSEETFTDIISGKGGACIFLLHGPPGVGKTLTAEAVAELLHKPLYSVTTGELGTDAAKLEHNLQEILETARAWSAITLIDEADIFLEKRADHDVARNALVGIFLRLLEYHQGILVLTTNRVGCFDEAFFSRITLSLGYQKLNNIARKEIWQTLCAAASIKGLDLDELAQHEVNGRQIKNIIKIAQALAFEETKQQHPSMIHINLAIQSTQAFQHDLDKINGSKISSSN